MNKMLQFRRALLGHVGQPVAFHMGGRGAAIASLVQDVVRGEKVSEAQLRDVMGYRDDEDDGPQHVAISAGPQVIPGGGPGKAVALVSVRGIALYDYEWQPYCFSSLLLAQTMNALANDPDIGTIVLDMDTPGGAVTGTKEAGDAIFAAREKKKVIVLVNPLCASAGYWLASQASQIIAVPSADIGSVGVFMAHCDVSGLLENEGIKITFIKAAPYKTEGNPYEPLTEEAKAYFQSEVDAIYADFLKTIARGRGVDVSVVRENFGQGRCMMAGPAKKAGLIDQIATIDVALSRIGVAQRPSNARRRGEDQNPAEGEQTQETASHDEFQPILLTALTADDGSTAVCAAGAWPKRTVIDPDALRSVTDDGGLEVTEAHVAITLANGKARYAIDGHDAGGRLLCSLVPGATFEPPPQAAEQAPAEQTARNPRHARLALLRH